MRRSRPSRAHIVLAATFAGTLVAAAAACNGATPQSGPAQSGPAQSAPIVTAGAAPSVGSPPTTTGATTTAPPATTTTTLDVADDVVAARLGDTIRWLQGIGPRVAGDPAERETAEALAALLRTFDANPVTVETFAVEGIGSSRNVSTALGKGPTRVLLGAHYDSKAGSPGVDDNGSGVAILVELARQLAAEPPAGLTVDIVFFGAEEIPLGFAFDQHHYGSRSMASRMAEAGTLPDYMVSVDMVGVGRRLVAAVYEGTDSEAALRLAEAGAGIGVDIAVEDRGDISDHEAFARAGVPAAFMWRPDNPAWHTVDDTTVDISLLLEDLAVLNAFLAGFGTG